MCKKRINLMKIIPKIALYTMIILFLSISLDEKAGSQVESPKINIAPNKSRMKVEVMPYGISDKIRVKHLIYKEKIDLNFIC